MLLWRAYEYDVDARMKLRDILIAMSRLSDLKLEKKEIICVSDMVDF